KRLVPIDIKSKDHEVITDLRFGKREPDKKHILQLQCYFYLVDKLMEVEGIEWELEKPTGGFLYYVSRQDPTYVKDVWVQRDDDLIDKSVETLKQLKNNFITG